MQLFLVALTASTAAGGWHARYGWRDQHIRVSPKLQQSVTDKLRRGLATVTKDVESATKSAIQTAERVFHAQRFNAREMGKPAHERRKLMDVSCSGRQCTVNGVTHADMSLFDCPWASSLHPYLNTSAAFAVDGGLCLPYQEIPFPYSVGTDPVDTTAANIVCPANSWDPSTATCDNAPGTCYFLSPGDGRGVAENYGCAAKQPGWPSTPTAELLPVCQKTYVGDCTYSKGGGGRGRNTRAYSYAPEAGITATDQGYDINWVLSEVGPLRNGLGAGTVMDADLGMTGFQFPSLYDFFYNVPTGTKPPRTGQYPHAFVKGCTRAARSDPLAPLVIVPNARARMLHAA